MTTAQTREGISAPFTNVGQKKADADSFSLDQLSIFPAQINLPAALQPIVAVCGAFFRQVEGATQEQYIGLIFGIATGKNEKAAPVFVETLARLIKLTNGSAKVFTDDVQLFMGPDFEMAMKCMGAITQGNLVQNAAILTQKSHPAFRLSLS